MGMQESFKHKKSANTTSKPLDKCTIPPISLRLIGVISNNLGLRKIFIVKDFI